MRRVGLFALLLVVTGAPAAAAKTIRVDWREEKQVGSGAVAFHVTRIVIGPSRWAVTFAITNRTHGSVRLTTPPRGTTPILDLRLLTTTQYRGETALVFTRRDRSLRAFDPSPSQLPHKIRKGATWTGTISGRGKMPHGGYTIGFGWFEPLDPAAGGRGFYWITDHSFRW